ncbi:transposase [Spirillospora sp. NPDC047279]|uniref:RNA-guided endonuclease InsQ/TnpB family protein n=1 Tax=Spirillospora sp. NPDC047279 TaxID=3155478 RepID=UPI0033DF7D9D
MKLVVQARLFPTPEQERALMATLEACNDAADHVSKIAFARSVTRNFDLRRLAYGELKARGLGAQAAQHVIKKVADAYASLGAQIRSGSLGPPGCGRRTKAESHPIRFRKGSAQPFDDRNLSWAVEATTISIWTVEGRAKGIPFSCGPRQLEMLARYRQGESDLFRRDGKWLLAATCEMPEAELNAAPADWIGVDRGIVNLASTSDGVEHAGAGLAKYRRRMARVRSELQAKATKSAKRKLKRRARREARHAQHVNHKIAKEIVADAARTGRGVALEDLGGIRDRVRFPRYQRATLSNWPFHQLGAHIEYRCRRDGVAFLEVDPAYTSQMCPVAWCGHTSPKNRPTRGRFECVICGFAGPADHIAALNVRQRARTAWAFLNMPHAAASPPRRRGQSRAASPRTNPPSRKAREGGRRAVEFQFGDSP